MSTNTILVMYSGGLDSLGALYLLLTDPMYAEYHIHVHHVDIQNVENRFVAERIAVSTTLEWFKQHQFKFTESYSGVGSPVYNGRFLYDSEITNFMAGHICACCPDITQVAFGVTKDDLADTGLPHRNRRANKIREAFTQVPKVYPLRELTKRQVYDMLPPELVALSWSCRTPRYQNGVPTPCGACKTCLVIHELNT